jgi:hypothetical protein
MEVCRRHLDTAEIVCGLMKRGDPVGIGEPLMGEQAVIRPSSHGGASAYAGSRLDCIEALGYVNAYRIYFGRGNLTWDERAYRLALDRAMDMAARRYYDHVTPDGECVNDMKEHHGFAPYENLAENLGGMTHTSDGTPHPETTAKEAAYAWLQSRGHRYNLLYPEHDSAAIGCFRSICVFIGVNKVPGGLGFGECLPGRDGLEAWENLPTQPDEVTWDLT